MAWVIAILLVYALFLALAARISIYPLRTPVFISPGAMGAPQEDVEFVSSDGKRLSGWWVGAPLDSGNAPPWVVVLAHGYMMSRAEPSPLAAHLWSEGYSCLLFDFRAHGRSEGKKCSLGWHERLDVIAAIDWVKTRFPQARVVLWGSSMGAAACAFAASERRELVEALVLDSAYSRLSDAIGGWWLFVGGEPLRLLLAPVPLFSRLFLDFHLSQVDVAEALRSFGSRPVLLMHGRRDTLARPDQAERNLAAVGTSGEVVWFDGCGHSEPRWIRPEQYRSELQRFLSAVRADSASQP